MWSDLPGSVLAADVAVRVARTTSLRPGICVVDVRAPGATPVEPGPARIAAVAEALARTSRTRRSSRAATGRLRDAGPRSSHVLQPQQLTACCQSSPSHQHPSPRWTTFVHSSLSASTASTMAMTASRLSMTESGGTSSSMRLRTTRCKTVSLAHELCHKSCHKISTSFSEY